MTMFDIKYDMLCCISELKDTQLYQKANKCLTYVFCPIRLNFCFLKTAKIPVYGNIAVYGIMALYVRL